MLKQAEEFLLCGKYILNIGNVCATATANYLHMNLYIFENLGGKAVIIQQRSAIEKATKGLFLRFTHKPNGTGQENHYNVIVDLESIPFHPIINEDKSKPSTPPTTPLTESTPISLCNIKTTTPATDPVTQQTQSTATTETVIGKAIVKLEPNHPHPRQKPGCHIYQQSWKKSPK